MAPCLEQFSDKAKASLLCNVFSEGFVVPEFKAIGCCWVDNLKSVNMYKHVMGDKLLKEFVNFRLLPLGIVPKKEVASFRLINHLSYLEKVFLNNEADKSSASVRYALFDQALVLLRKFGCNALMAKADM